MHDAGFARRDFVVLAMVAVVLVAIAVPMVVEVRNTPRRL